MKKNEITILLAQWISSIGNNLHQIALPLLVYQKTGSSGDFALTLLAETLPWVFVAPILSPYLKRFSAKSILVFSDLLRAILTLIIAFYNWKNFDILIIVFFIGCLSSIYGAFRSQAIKFYVQSNSLTKYISLSNAGSEFISIFAPLLGTLLITLGISASKFMMIDSITFLISLFLLLRLPKNNDFNLNTKTETNKSTLIFKFVKISKIVKTITWSECFRSVAEGLFIPSLLTLFIKINSFDSTQYTWIRTAMGLAGILSAYLFIKVTSRENYFKIHNLSTLLIALGVGLLPIIANYNTTLFIAVIIGFGMSFKQILTDNIVYNYTNENVQAETVTIVNSMIAFSYCLGYVISAKFDDINSVKYLFYSASILLFTSLMFSKNLKPSQIQSN